MQVPRMSKHFAELLVTLKFFYIIILMVQLNYFQYLSKFLDPLAKLLFPCEYHFREEDDR